MNQSQLASASDIGITRKYVQDENEQLRAEKGSFSDHQTELECRLKWFQSCVELWELEVGRLNGHPDISNRAAMRCFAMRCTVKSHSLAARIGVFLAMATSSLLLVDPTTLQLEMRRCQRQLRLLFKSLCASMISVFCSSTD